MRTRFILWAVCVLLATMMFGGTAFAVMSAPIDGKSMTIGNASDDLWMTGHHLTVGISNTIYSITKDHNDFTGDNEVVLLNSLDGGTTWERSKVMYSTAARIGGLGIAADPDGTVHIVWSEGNTIYYRSNTSASVVAVNAVDEGIEEWEFRVVAMPSGGATVVFAGQNTTNSGIFYNKGVLNGGVMEFDPSSTHLSGSILTTVELDAVSIVNDVYIVGATRSGDQDIKIWKNDNQLTSVCGTYPRCMGGTSAVSMAASSSAIYIVWNGDNNEAAPGIYYRKLNADGTWPTTSPAQVSTDDPYGISTAVESTGNPVIATSDGPGKTLKFFRYKSSNGTWLSQSLSLPFSVYSASLVMNAKNKACITQENQTNHTLQLIREQ